MLKKSLLITIPTTIVGALIFTALVTYRALPDNNERTDSQHIPMDNDSLLSQQLFPLTKENPNLTGVYLLDDSHNAFLARLALTEVAEKTLDIQYYIWHDDISGRLLLQSLYRAAERGVRVRLLLDDNNTVGMDEILSKVDDHPNIEVRLFNPFMQRKVRVLGFLSDFFRLNRRMHNKSLTADGIVTIVGGRNIGDEYFGAGSGVVFADLDVAAVGSVAQEVGTDFDKYWHSKSAYPAKRIISKKYDGTFNTTTSDDVETTAYIEDLKNSEFASQLKEGNLPLTWVNAELISDNPAKVLKETSTPSSMIDKMSPLMEATKQELIIVSPYFVPTKYGSEFLTDIATPDKKITVLTNSLAATDVLPVHSGYAKHRKHLLSSGVKLYELKPNATVVTKKGRGFVAKKGASLHAKTFVIDKEKLFIGSYNMDPRSAVSNTEMGLIINSPEMATILSDNLQQDTLMQLSYQVTQNDKGKLQWTTLENNESKKYDKEPESSTLNNMALWFFSVLPIDILL